MRRYLLLVGMLVMLWGTEAMAVPSVFISTCLDETCTPSAQLPVTNTFESFPSSTFTLFQRDSPLVPLETIGRDKVIISIVNAPGTSFYIDNIQVTEDGEAGKTFGFDTLVSGPFTSIPAAQEVGEFFIRGTGSPWFVSTSIGNLAPSIFVNSVGSAQSDFTISIPKLDPNTGRLKDSGFKFTFHSADLKIGTSSCDINGCGGPGNVPEPASLLLLGAGLAGIGIWRWKATKAEKGV